MPSQKDCKTYYIKDKSTLSYPIKIENYHRDQLQNYKRIFFLIISAQNFKCMIFKTYFYLKI